MKWATADRRADARRRNQAHPAGWYIDWWRVLAWVIVLGSGLVFAATGWLVVSLVFALFS